MVKEKSKYKKISERKARVLAYKPKKGEDLGETNRERVVLDVRNSPEGSFYIGSIKGFVYVFIPDPKEIKKLEDSCEELTSEEIDIAILGMPYLFVGVKDYKNQKIILQKADDERSRLVEIVRNNTNDIIEENKAYVDTMRYIISNESRYTLEELREQYKRKEKKLKQPYKSGETFKLPKILKREQRKRK